MYLCLVRPFGDGTFGMCRDSIPFLGTFITEWKDGEQICAEFLSDSAKLVTVVDQLARIAAKYRFDGWLLNIENPIDVSKPHFTSRFYQPTLDILARGKFDQFRRPTHRQVQGSNRTECLGHLVRQRYSGRTAEMAGRLE